MYLQFYIFQNQQQQKSSLPHLGGIQPFAKQLQHSFQVLFSAMNATTLLDSIETSITSNILAPIVNEAVLSGQVPQE